MKLLIIAGFLGSGKTTLLLEVAQRLVAVPQKIAIIENEVGEIGIDGKYLHQEGLQVQELFGGFICCTLSADLVSTLEKVSKNKWFRSAWFLGENANSAQASPVFSGRSIREGGQHNKSSQCAASSLVGPLRPSQMDAVQTAITKLELKRMLM